MSRLERPLSSEGSVVKGIRFCPFHCEVYFALQNCLPQIFLSSSGIVKKGAPKKLPPLGGFSDLEINTGP